MDYTIKDMCQKLNMTVHTVRHYCDMGLVPNLRYDKNGNRIFNEESVNWLQGAKFLRASGLSISEIRHYFSLCQMGKSSMKERLNILIKLKSESEQELAELQHRIDCLSDKIVHCQHIIDADGDDDCNPLNW